jgi:hypothetical protein
MQEEQAVLEFFARPENLPLALSVAEQTDLIREQLNNRFWLDSMQDMRTFIDQHDLRWQLTATEDRNAPDSVVGFHCAPDSDQPLYLRPMMEQQNLGTGLRIYFGLMWSGTPTPENLALPAVRTLLETLKESGFKNNENYLGWQWTNLRPRTKSFLLRFTQQPATLLSEIESSLGKLLLNNREPIDLANAALRSAPRSMTISLDQLRARRTT